MNEYEIMIENTLKNLNLNNTLIFTKLYKILNPNKMYNPNLN